MADFVAVLRKALDGLSEPTPEMRARVYDKARAAVSGKLAALNPLPPAALVERQKKALEDAIASVESEYAPAKPAFEDPLEELESVFAALKEGKPIAPAKPVAAPVVAAAVAPRSEARPVAPADAPPSNKADVFAQRTAPVAMPKVEPRPETPVKAAPPRVEPKSDKPVRAATPARAEPDLDDDFRTGQKLDDGDADFENGNYAFETYEQPPRRRGYGGLIAAALGLLVVAGAGYGVWLNKDEFSQALGLNSPATTAEPATPAAETPEPAPATQETDVAAAPPADATPPADAAQPNAQQAQDEEPKMTQRLNADGTEADAGPAGGEQTFGEGTSVAALTTPVAADQPPATPPAGTPPADAAATPPADAAATPPADAAAAPPADAAAPTDPAQPPAVPGAPLDAATPPADAAAAPPADAAAPTDPAQPPAVPGAPLDAATPPAGQPAQTAAVEPQPQQLAVGQRAIFYEERTSVAQGSAEPGTIVWSEVRESPGGDAPPEPAIRAEATIPGKDIQLRMTIRRNMDKTLPASHIIEMIFLTPDNFEGGGIDNVLRIAFKNSEQDAGSPLSGIPAKIADGFFLIALNDSKNEIDNNLNLLRRQSWIDIPIVYKNGRRALFTMEKGLPGEKVFDDTMKAWGPNTAG